MTAALGSYRSASATVGALLVLESSYADPPTPTEQPTVEGLRGGAVVLMVGAFEQYLKESIAEILDRVNHASPPCDFDKLPLDLRTNTVYTALEAAMRAKAWDPLKAKSARLPGVLVTIDRLNRREMLSAEVANTAGNPDANQVRAIFKVIGLPSVFTNIKAGFDGAWGSPTASTYLEDTLNAIVQRRHVVAHTASVLAISRHDLSTWHTFMDTLVLQIDAALERHIKRVIARAQ